MTDVAPKTPNKRKSFGGKQGSPKKTKLENGQTPQQLGSAKKQNKQTPKLQKTQDTPAPQKNQQTPKQKNQQTPKPQKNQGTPNPQKNQGTPNPQKNQGTPNPQKNLKQNLGTPPNLNKSNKKAKKGAGETKATPFKGTSQIQVPKPNVKKEQNDSTKTTEVKVKKPRKDQFFSIKEQIRSSDNNVKLAAVTSIEAKIKEIESRGNLTKTATRKLKMLQKFKKIAQGIQPVQQVKNPNAKSESSKRRERRNKSNKEGDVKVEKGAKKVPVIKQENKKVAPVKEDPEDSDDSEEEELSIGKLVQPEAASDDEDDSGEEEEGSDEEEEGDDDDESSEESD